MIHLLSQFFRRSHKQQEEIKQHSWWVAMMLIVCTLGGTFGVGYVVQKSIEIRKFDAAGYEALMNMPHPAWLDALVSPVNYNFLPFGGQFIPSFLFILIVAALAWLSYKNPKLVGWAILSLIIGFLYSKFLYDITAAIIFRARPFTVLPNNLSETAKAAWIAWNSFPSGHTKDTAMYGTIIASYIPALRIPMIILALFVGFSRVYLGAHYPTDALAGLIIGLLAGVVSLMLTREIQLVFTNFRGRIKSDTPQ